MPIFTVKNKGNEATGLAVRMVKAERRSQVESYVLQDFEIERCDAEKAAELGAGGVKVESVT